MGEDSRAIQDLARAVERLSLIVERQQSRSGPSAAEEWELVPPTTGDHEGPPTSQEPSIDERLALVAAGDYEAVADLIPIVPDHLVVACQCLHGGGYSRDYRAKRAWDSGFWARAVLAGKVEKPRASLPLDLKPSTYIILKAPGLRAPTRVCSASDLYRITGRLGPGCLCHGFASLVEAKIYCEAAGVPVPEVHQWN